VAALALQKHAGLARRVGRVHIVGGAGRGGRRRRRRRRRMGVEDVVDKRGPPRRERH